ncbi:MAG: AraC family transcriptional regulator, partial [Deltaproteobacteria bacterium]
MTCKSIAMIAALCAGAFACHPTPAPSAGPTTVYVNDGTAAAQPAAQPAPAAAAQPAPAAAAQPAPAAAPA